MPASASLWAAGRIVCKCKRVGGLGRRYDDPAPELVALLNLLAGVVSALFHRRILQYVVGKPGGLPVLRGQNLGARNMPQREREPDRVLGTAAPLPREAFFRPLDAVRWEHNRQFKISNWLLQHASDERIEPFEDRVDELLDFLSQDLVLHHKDEEEDLFPTLRKRCKPQDGVDAILAELVRDHATEGFLMRDIVADLHRVVKRQDLETPSRFFISLRLFAEGQQRHLSWENEVVLPLAKKRLTEIDLETLGRSMLARRGEAHPG